MTIEQMKIGCEQNIKKKSDSKIKNFIFFNKDDNLSSVCCYVEVSYFTKNNSEFYF